MKRSIYLIIPSLLLASALTACGTRIANTSAPTKPENTNLITNNPSDMPELGASDYNAQQVSIDSHSPYQDYAVILAHYLSMKFDTSVFKHITIQYVNMDAKPQDQNKPTGQVTLLVAHQPGKSSNYNEGKNIRFVQFVVHSDGSKSLESIATSPIINQTSENPGGPIIPQENPDHSTLKPKPPALDLPQGIINTINPIGKQYNMKNAWQKVIGNRFVQVYAGAFVDDPKQGVVVVHDNTVDLSKVNIQEYKTPTKHGSIKVEAESGNVLTLRAEDGVTYLFDADTLQFVALQD
jgi:hypothetical protein